MVSGSGFWLVRKAWREREKERRTRQTRGRGEERSRGKAVARRARGTRGRRRNGTGECSLEPITVARPGVRQTLYSFSNNANKRASILRFYRVALSVFDNGPSGQRRSRARRALPKAVSRSSRFNRLQRNQRKPAFVPVIHPLSCQRVCCTPAAFLRFVACFFAGTSVTNSLRDCPFSRCHSFRNESRDRRAGFQRRADRQPNFCRDGSFAICGVVGRSR